MDYKDLVERLREWLEYDHARLIERSRDRIEQVLKDAEAANATINHWIIAYDSVEAKLDKAVEVLQLYADGVTSTTYARTVLDEFKVLKILDNTKETL
jgi:hypothetical protein